MTDGERGIVNEQERDARETEEAIRRDGNWVTCEACGGSGFRYFYPESEPLDPNCPECLGLGTLTHD